MIKGKGSSFERQVCNQLSLWWSQGERTDLFWRTANSGGRATVRAKRGEKTRSHYGDICATDPDAQILIDTICLELKRGYNKDTVSDLLDKSTHARKQTYHAWFEKIAATSKLANTVSWALIARRDKREAVIYTPLPFLMRLVDLGAFHLKLDESQPFIMLRAVGLEEEIAGMRLDTFFGGVSSDHVVGLKRVNRNVG